MCRWMAWLGQPVLIEEGLFKTQHGIVGQSLQARMGAEPTNGDGFGLGWHGGGEGPGLYRSASAAHIQSPLFLTHVRAAIGSPVQHRSCHPFRHGRWLFVHNGFANEFHLMAGAGSRALRGGRGHIDIEVVFRLARTHGLETDPRARSSGRWR